MKNITVIGCGSTGMATSAYLAEKGHAVTLCDTDEQYGEDYSAIHKSGGIVVEGKLGFDNPIPLAKLSNDFKESVSDAEIIILCISAGRHIEVSDNIFSHLKSGQVVLFVPGNMGSVYLRRKLNERDVKNIVVAEMSGNLWACRRLEPGKVLVALPYSKKKIATLPGSDIDMALSGLDGILEVEKGKNVIETTLNSPNVITHVGGSIINAVQIERQGEDFALFMDGLSEVFIQCNNKLEEERELVMKHLGLQLYDLPGEGLFRNLMKDSTPPGFIEFKSLKGPSSLSHRYVTEDANCGVALLVSIAERYGLKLPITKSFLNIAGLINNTDYLATGYTLNNLKIEGCTSEKLNEELENFI